MVVLTIITAASCKNEKQTPKVADATTKTEKIMNVLFVLTSHDDLGETGEKTGFWIEEFAREYLQEKWNKENDLDDEVVLIGGGTVFEESILIVNKLVLTRVDCEIIGDIFYPDIDLIDWTMISEESHAKDADNEYNFKIETYLKN